MTRSTPSSGGGEARTPKSAKGEKWGLLNPYGDLWTHDTFHSPEDATTYAEQFWRGHDVDLRRFKPIRVTVRVSATAAQLHEARKRTRP